MKTLKEVKALFSKFYGDDEKLHSLFSPGRVNLIGEHIDYNGGDVLPLALSVGTKGFIKYRDDGIIRLRSLNAEGEIYIDLSREVKYDEHHKWSNYPRGVIKYLVDEEYPVSGGDILFESTMPISAGLSSSASIEILTGWMILYRKFGDTIDRIRLAKLCQRSENEFVGVKCGIMDQFIVAMGKRGHAILLNCNNLKYEYIPIYLKKHSLLLMDTNKKRSLSNSRYNERRVECEDALRILNKHHDVENLCQASINDINNYIKDDTLKKRAHHVVSEQKRVLESVKMLKEVDIEGFGRLLTASHESLKNYYEVTGLELDTLVQEALRAEGCIGSRMTGAGFGGCAIALVENRKIDVFKEQVAEGYTEETGLNVDFYLCEISDGCRFIE